jgi:hypothetical protein
VTCRPWVGWGEDGIAVRVDCREGAFELGLQHPVEPSKFAHQTTTGLAMTDLAPVGRGWEPLGLEVAETIGLVR